MTTQFFSQLSKFYVLCFTFSLQYLCYKWFNRSYYFPNSSTTRFMFYDFSLLLLYPLVSIQQILCFMFYFFLCSKVYFFLLILYSPYNSSTRFTFYVLCFVSFVTLFSVSIQQGLCFMFYLLFTTLMLHMLSNNGSTWFSYFNTSLW